MSSPVPRATAEAVATARAAAQAISDKKGEDVMLLDLSHLLVVTDVFLIASGTSTRHVKTLVEDAEVVLRELGRKPIRREGMDHGEWVLLDYGDVVLHVFDKETREYYDLERLWADAPRIAFESSSTAVES
ncbi:MAG: ribosome silencing factor [Armatimonadetes bacterium]|nr:MAG: ribosome silencing factor [Armatimonadota bacterium]